MKSVHPYARALLLVALAAVLVALTLPAVRLSADEAAGPAYTLDWWTVDGGGQTGGGGKGYSLQGTAGQPDAALWKGGHYTLAGGFWCAGEVTRVYKVYVPLVMR
jgi:hypothetical protein